MKVSENFTNRNQDKVNDISKEVKNNDGSGFSKEDKLINAKNIGTDYNFKHEVVWINVILFFILHVLGFWGLLRMLTGQVGWKTIAWSFFVGYAGGEGVTIGAHRCYTHKSFKAKPVLRAFFILLQTIAGQNSMFTWCRDHRLHHRYTDTDADPHNINRGFFFSHIGWLLTKKHPYVKELGREIDMSDLQADWMVQFQKKYYLPLYIVFSLILPLIVPVIYFGESWSTAFLVVYAWRYVQSLNTTWLVNSAAHIYGTRPYDKNLQPVESWVVSLLTLGEGWHNYHHAFPWDYKASELGMPLNASASIIEFLVKIGLAYDLKIAPNEMVHNRIKKKGDGTHDLSHADTSCNSEINKQVNGFRIRVNA